jgi:hypothetical protein
MHGGGRPHRDDTGDSPNLVEMTLDDDQSSNPPRITTAWSNAWTSNLPLYVKHVSQRRYLKLGAAITREEIDFTGLWHSQHYSSV